MTTHTPNFSMGDVICCAAIGEGNILLSCLKILEEAHFKITAVLTETQSIRSYCDESCIQWWERKSNLEEILKDKPIQYLFSISNPRILKENELQLPKILTINYHDSPLPAYAGVHATSWAIINGESEHGVSWHIVEPGIDTGDILKFRKVNIDKKESALALNLKCQEAGIVCFEELVNDIKTNSVVRSPQPKEGRSYFGLHAIPPNLGVLSFDQKPKDTFNLARALEFGHHENSLGCAKVLTSTEEFVVVTTAEVACRFPTGTTKPGTILDIVDDSLIVSTLGQPLLLSVAKLNGSSIPLCNFRKHGLVTGLRLVSGFSVDTSSLSTIRKREAFWKRKLDRYEPTTFFKQRMNVVAGIIDLSDEIHLETKSVKLPSVAKDDNEFIMSTLVAFIGRVCCTSNVNVGLIANKSQVPKHVETLYSDICPAIFQLNMASQIRDVLDTSKGDMKKYSNSSSFLIDVFYRYPELRERKQTLHHNIVIGKSVDLLSDILVGKKVLQDCNILLLYSSETNEIHIHYSKKPGQDLGFIFDIFKHFPIFLSSITKNTSQLLCDVSLVPQKELKVLYPSPTENPKQQASISLIDILENSADYYSSRIALKTSTMSCSYQKVMQMVGSFSALLRETALNGRKRVIGLHLPNSIAYVVSVLSVLKCKHVFLPLPLDYPKERLIFTVNDCRVQTIVTTKERVDKLNINELLANPKIVNAGTIDGVDLYIVQFSEVDEFEKTHSMLLQQKDNFENLAYIMYTSGSTGKPKGVKVRESSVVNLAKAQIQLWDLNPQDIIGQFASIGFDATVSEIFTAVFSGATLVIFNEKERLGQEFLLAMNKHKISTITLPPSLLNVYSPKDLPYLKKIVTAGEACTLSTAVKWAEKNERRFFNAYGPTEATVCATCFEFIPENKHEDVNCDLSIGTSIPGVDVYLFDDYMKPLPPGVIGEIYIGGLGLSEGYHGHASHLTKEKFVQHPLINSPITLYKTGDHGLQDSDGNITFVGRLDDMLKIRGQRVDLNEIEQVLIQHPKVDVAVVVPHRCINNNDLSIAAFVSPTFIFSSELREYLVKVLPKYMIPNFIKKLDISEFPKTINGKLDRKQLEKDESIHEQNQAVGHSHLNEIQLQIAQIWCTILKLNPSFAYSLHRQSSFSELGGNSLQLVLLQRYLEDAFGLPLSFSDIGSADTIEEFSDVVKRKRDVLTKNEQINSQDDESLRNLIISDSNLTRDLFLSQARRGSVDIPHISATNPKSYLRYPKNILISGVTGFLGAYLLSELLEKSNAHICCMVRETSETRGIGRIFENLRRYDLFKFEYTNRIAVVISDLSQPRLGIAPDIYKSLCNSIDAVFMNAAMMNFNTDYLDHRTANVLSTKEFIKFALTGVQKMLFSTSTLGVFLFPPKSAPGEPNNQILYECDEMEDPIEIAGGYGQSKWASERLVMQALDLLPGGAIFRPARISGCTIKGFGPKNDLFASTLIGMRKLGYFPDMDFPYDLTPVDYVAKAIVEISLRICNDRGKNYERVFHLFNKNTMPFNRLFDGENLKPLSLEEWRKVLKSAPEDNKELIPLTPFFFSSFWDRSPYWPIFDTTNTDFLISNETKQLLRPSKELLLVYKKYFGMID